MTRAPNFLILELRTIGFIGANFSNCRIQMFLYLPTDKAVVPEQKYQQVLFERGGRNRELCGNFLTFIFLASRLQTRGAAKYPHFLMFFRRPARPASGIQRAPSARERAVLAPVRRDVFRGSVSMRMKCVSCFVFVLATLALLTAPQLRANSITLNYNYQSGGNTFTWQLPVNPILSSTNYTLSYLFTFNNLSFTENGVAMTGTMDFYSTMNGGGFDLYLGSGPPQPPYLADALGMPLSNPQLSQQLYSGPESAPTMLTGTFTLADYATTDPVNYNGPGIPGTLQVTPVTTVPEPSTLLLMTVAMAFSLAVAAFLRKN